MKKMVDDAKSRNSDFSGPRLTYFNWKNGDRKIVRFLTNEIISANVYSFVITNDGKSQSFLVKPGEDYVQKYMSSTPGGPGWQINYGTKQPEPARPKEQGIGLAVLRDLVPRAGGGFDVVDVTAPTEFKGQTFQARTFGIIQQSPKNFWGSLQGYHDIYGTITDRDYLIVREGGDKDTRYIITPLDAIEELKDPAALQAAYGYGHPTDTEDPDRFMYCPQTLNEWAEWFSSEERARSLLLPGAPAPAATAPVSAPSSVPQFAPTAVAPVITAPVAPQAATSGLGEFHPATTHNPADEAQAAPPVVAPSTQTDFSSIRETLLAPRQ